MPSETNPPPLIEYPVAFPIKVMGKNEDGFLDEIVQVAQRFDPEFNAESIEVRPSSGSNYLGLTITVMATSREHLDDIYRALTSHPKVKYVL